MTSPLTELWPCFCNTMYVCSRCRTRLTMNEMQEIYSKLGNEPWRDPAQTRMARVISDHTVEDVANYLPDNYSAKATSEGVLVYGRDYMGWTLHEYVLPRLGSALIAAKEIL